ncbi:MAG: aldo/keto reductase [Thermoplasmata archaeon]|nr:aldo/keto reductase [Thermoplasmata archaeon]
MKPRRAPAKKPKAARSAPSTSPQGPFTPGPGLPMGTTSKLHPAIGMGLWALGRWTHEDEVRTTATLRRALEMGLRWFDTAEVYGTGRSERLLGDVLSQSGALVPPVFLSTKLSWEHLRASQVRASLLGSLQRIGRSSIDLYLVHAPDPRVPVRETMGVLEALWKEGRIGSIGVSNFSVDQLEAARSALAENEIVTNQVLYNMFDRREGDDVLDYCRHHAIVVEAYTPLARGLLAGRYLDGKLPAAEVRLRTQGLFEGERFGQVVVQARELRMLAEQEKVPMASLALHWLARQGVAPIVGASRPEQVEELATAWSVRPTDSALDRADELSRG